MSTATAAEPSPRGWPTEKGPLLLALARASLAHSLGGPSFDPPDVGWLGEPGACFVTLTQEGTLRGCIGSIEARRPLREDVLENARGAAFHDPRFPPLLAVELPQTRIEVSLLSPLEQLTVESEEEALRKLRPGIDGVFLEWGFRRGVFIPQMWQKLPDPKRFLECLKEKAGLPLLAWLPGTKVSRFTAQCWEEPEPSEEGARA
ncbi:MAG: AmmeMemoRadiSam system protein A [Myxococcales bacterium]|nr:AmmeMemoRadiSam system protein A [Myxococcales bacterium]